jgi:hypothetical protein
MASPASAYTRIVCRAVAFLISFTAAAVFSVAARGGKQLENRMADKPLQVQLRVRLQASR